MFDIQRFALFGKGTSTEPYYIPDVEDLAQLAADVNAGESYEGKFFKVTANLDISGYTNWTPIGNNANTFKGTFDGYSYTINGLTINNPSENYQGLFGAISSSAIVKMLS